MADAGTPRWRMGLSARAAFKARYTADAAYARLMEIHQRALAHRAAADG